MYKRMVLGKFAQPLDALERRKRAADFALKLLEGSATTKAVLSEEVARGPRGDSFGFDFLLEAWTEDDDASFDSRRATIAAQAVALDAQQSRTVLARQHVVKTGCGAVKGSFLSKRRPGSTVDEYLRYWRGQHADIIQAQTDFFAYVRAYVQNHFVHGTFLTLEGNALSQEDSFDGSPQMWFDSPDDIYSAFATNGYHKHIKADEQILVKVGYSQSFICQEFPLVF